MGNGEEVRLLILLMQAGLETGVSRAPFDGKPFAQGSTFGTPTARLSHRDHGARVTGATLGARL
jgi:hypothetical protein